MTRRRLRVRWVGYFHNKNHSLITVTRKLKNYKKLYLRDYDNRISWVIGQNYVKITGPKKNLKSFLKEKQTIAKKYLFSKTRGESLKKMSQMFKIAIHFHCGHPEQDSR